MTTGSAASKLLINFSACSFLWSWARVKIASQWKPEIPGTSWAVARVNALRDFFTGDVLNLHFLAADSFRYGRQRGLNENANACWPSRRKYSRTHGGHRDGTNGGMSRTFIVDFWMTSLVSHAGNARMCVDRNNTIFDGFKADVSITDLCLCAEAREMLFPWIIQAVLRVFEGGGSSFITTWRLYFRVDPYSWYDVEMNNDSYTVEGNSTGCN